jgi:serine protease Do
MKRIMKKIIAAAVMMAAFCGQPALAQEIPQSNEQVQLSFAPLVKKTAPAVVNIYAKVMVRQRVANPLFNDPFFNRFFYAPGMGGGLVQERIENSLGSGVIVDEAGLVATNTHVIRNATEIIVVTSDGREFSAEKILADDKTDLAILRVDSKGEKLPWLTFADSDALEVGDIVLAIGNPFGVGQTVTSGIVSGLGKTGIGTTDYGFFIQTDAAINPGNSGGALIDVKGRLVGVNSMIFSKDGGSLGIGFAIPANMVKAIVEASRRGGKLVRPWTGITGQPVTSDMVESLGLKRATGALINKLHPKGPAAKAGLRVGDVILEMDGWEVKSPEAMKFRLATLEIGAPVKLKAWRGGKEFETEMLTETPLEDVVRDESTLSGAHPLAGATVANISPAVAEELGGLEEDAGVVVMRAEKGVAQQLGILSRDIVISVNGQKIPDVQQLKKVLSAPRGRVWQIQLMRGRQMINLSMRL